MNKSPGQTSSEIRDAYTDRIRDAMTLEGANEIKVMTKEDYISALQTIMSDIAGMIEATTNDE